MTDDVRFLDDVLVPPPRHRLRTTAELWEPDRLPDPPTLWPMSEEPSPLWYLFPHRTYHEIWATVYQPALDALRVPSS